MKRSVAARHAPHTMNRGAGHGLRGAILPGDTIYCGHPTRGPVVVKVLADGAHGLTGEAEGLGRVRVPWQSVLGIHQRMTARWSVVEQGGDGATLEAEDGRRHFIRGDLAATDHASLREQGRDDEDDDPLLGRLGPDGAPAPRRARGRREDSKIAATADTDGDGVVEGADEGDPAHRGTPGQRSRGADRKVRCAAAGAALVTALAGDTERNPPGSAERRASAFHEAGHAIASFALDSMLHGRGWGFRIGVLAVQILPVLDDDGMLARADTINRRRDRTWGQALPADDPRLPQLLRDAAMESIEVLAGTFAEMRHEADDFTAARCRPDCTEFLEAVLDAGQPAALDEAKVELRLGFIQRHTGRGAADILRNLEDATWALLASEWPAVEAVAEALDQKSHLEGLTALGIWSASRLPLGQRDDAAGAVSPSGMRVLTELAEAVEPDAGTSLPWCR